MRFKIEYDVKVNDQGRPYIEIENEFNGVPEHRFFAFEITRYILYDLIEKNRGKTANSRISEEAMLGLESTAVSLTRISDEMAKLIYGNMTHSLNIEELLKLVEYDITVDFVSDLEQIKNGGFVFNDKIYTKKHGLKVKVLENMCVYELQGELDNEHWVNLTPNHSHEDENPENETQN